MIVNDNHIQDIIGHAIQLLEFICDINICNILVSKGEERYHFLDIF